MWENLDRVDDVENRKLGDDKEEDGGEHRTSKKQESDTGMKN